MLLVEGAAYDFPYLLSPFFLREKKKNIVEEAERYAWVQQAGENFEIFSSLLSELRQGIIGGCLGHRLLKQTELRNTPLNDDTYPDDWVDDDWVEQTRLRLILLNGKEGRLWDEPVQEAWRHLTTPQDRLHVLKLLHDAAREFAQQIHSGPQFWRITKKERETRSRALQKGWKQVKKTINAAGQTLAAYGNAVMEAEAYLHKSKWVVISNASFDWFKGPPARSQEIRECVEELGRIADRLQKFEPPPLFATGRGQRGRREKSAQNIAILELERLLLANGLSRNKAIEYIHCLLCITGVWADPEPSGLAVKLSQLHKRPAR